MLYLKLLYLQWKQRNLLFIAILISAVLTFTLLVRQNQATSFIANLLTGDHYFATFTALIPNNTNTPKIIEEIRSWSGVVQLKEINAKKVMRQLKEESTSYGIELPSLLTEQNVQLFSVNIDPFLPQKNIEMIRSRLIGIFPNGSVVASPIRTPDLMTQHSTLTVLLMRYGTMMVTGIFFILVLILNIVMFKALCIDALVWQSINRAKALSIKSYALIQLVIVVTGLILNATSPVINVLVPLSWIIVNTVIALAFYAMWGRKSLG